VPYDLIQESLPLQVGDHFDYYITPANLSRLHPAGRSDGGTGSDEGGVEFRCFCPRLGIDEDQVTGSACVNLALIYARLHEKYGTWVQARQQSKAGGEMRFQVPSRLEAKVLLSGQAREIVP
jgi:predicted PhzF superfamily epimerase YddE/YHI9